MEDRPLTFISSLILSACFLAALVLPAAESFLHFAPNMTLSEKRVLQKYPRFEWNPKALLSYPSAFEAAFNDHFGLRAFLVRSQARAKLRWLHMSSSPKVALGRDGWWYLTESFDEYRGVRKLPRATTLQWLQEFKAKKTFFASRNIKYLVVIAPNKETVYPEFLPANIVQAQSNFYVDDFLKAVPAESQLNVLDLRETLIGAKHTGQLYFKTDSHWNQLGATIACDAVIRRLSSWLPELQFQPDSHEFRTKTGKSGDLSHMMSLEDRMHEESIMLLQRAPAVRQIAPRMRKKISGILTNEAVMSVDTRNSCNAIVTGDSFSNAISIFLPGHFQRTLKFRPYLSYKDPIFKAIVAAEKPDVYLEILVDRHLINPPQVLSSQKKNPND
jgi:alginate O-acetyltransferase complex protein AlgJ